MHRGERPHRAKTGAARRRQANKLWSGSYFAGSVGGAPISVLRHYVEQHNRPASTTAHWQEGLRGFQRPAIPPTHLQDICRVLRA
ncbi:transposase [Actinomadura sp. 7K507]|uniref:transposase n=1 Tax=Actinomadura sp. 7K507 TaxID=2530365 RepID=UPI001A9F7088|nr:transposase [Actinomadura sp. 7K507]